MEPYQQNQPPYPPQQPYGYPAQNQQPYGQQYPQYGPPQQWGPPQPPKKSKTGLIVGIIGGVVILLTVLLFAGCSYLASEINGGGGSHKEKAAAMVAMADEAPESDWTLLNRYDPKWEEGCLSIDTHCLKLSASWEVDHDVSIYEVGTRMGLNMDESKPGMGGGCLVVAPYDGNSRSEICVNEYKDSPGEYQVDLHLTRK